MAQQTVVTLIDDLDGGRANGTVHFGLDGVAYAIDLSDDNAEKLRAGLADFVKHARRADGRKQRRAQKTVVPAGGDREQNQAIRQWARSAGHQVSERGRISQELIVQFREAHAD